MEALIVLGVILVIYLILFFFDVLFKSCMHLPYDSFLRGTGLRVQFMRIEWYTTAFNRAIVNWSSKGSRLMRKSFNLGVYLGLLLVPLSLICLIYVTVSPYLKGPANETGYKPVELEILVPGVTLPFNEIGYYIGTLLLCSIVHEFGHAYASVLEGVPLIGFGIKFYFILPMAYTELGTEALERLKYWKKLRVLCAGVWNNLILGLISYLILMELPILARFAYRTETGIYVTEVDPNSAFAGPRGLKPGDIIQAINNFKTMDENSFYDGLINAVKNRPKYCVSSDYILVHDESVNIDATTLDEIVDCCEPGTTESVCFEHFVASGILEIPPFMCLNVRNMIEGADGYCDEQGNCGANNYCIKPLIDNRTTIIHVRLRERPNVVYLGSPGDIYKAIKWSQYIPLTSVSPKVLEGFILFFKYLTVFSFGLAFINILPCYGFDGQFIVTVIAVNILEKRIRKRRRRHILAFVITLTGSVFLFIVVSDFIRKNIFNELYY